MASSKDYLTFVLEQLSDLDSISYRAMMGEYILYYRDKIVGGIYDDRLLVKPVSSAISLMSIPIEISILFGNSEHPFPEKKNMPFRSRVQPFI